MSLGDVCPKNFGSGLPYGVVSEASKPSVGASWQRLAVDRPISVSICNPFRFKSFPYQFFKIWHNTFPFQTIYSNLIPRSNAIKSFTNTLLLWNQFVSNPISLNPLKLYPFQSNLSKMNPFQSNQVLIFAYSNISKPIQSFNNRVSSSVKYF